MSRRAPLWIGLVVVAALGAAYYIYTQGANTVQPQGAAAGTASAAEAPLLKPHRVAPQGKKEYYNERYRFSFFYPSNLTAKEYDEGGGAMTFIFQDAEAAQGLQIFVVPYSAPQVSAERFKQDVPSGVRQGAQDVDIDGATATSFYSTNTALGETAEVWFIHDGYLFEVTTLKPLAPWFAQIMVTWWFL